MKLFRVYHGKKSRQHGFSLVEATFSIGLLSCGFLTLAPLLALGLKDARLARNDRVTAQIAQTVIEEARQGISVTGTSYLDFEGGPCNPSEAAYTAQTVSTPIEGNPLLNRLTVRLTPLGAPDRARTYAVVLPAAE